MAANPNTPAESLARLAEPFPHAVLGNPVLPLLLLEHADWLLNLPANAVMKLLACAEMPAALVRQQMRHPNSCVREAAAMHVVVRGTSTHAWEVEAQEGFVAKDSNLQFAVSGDAPADSRGYYPNCVFLLPGSLPQWVLRALLMHPYQYNQFAASYHPDAVWLAHAVTFMDEPSIFRGHMLGHPGYTRAAEQEQSLATYLCSNTGTSRYTLRELANSDQPLLRWLLAQNPSLPRDVLYRLAVDPIYAVRDGVLRNRRCPPELARSICVQLLMADVPTNPVLYRVLAFASPFMPPAFLARHAAAPDWLERYAIARNPETPLHVLGALAEDGVLVVRMAARAVVHERVVAALAQTPPVSDGGDSL